MKIEQAKEIVFSSISKVLKKKLQIKDETHLIGNNAILDSMLLVEVCLALEDAAEKHGFEFDWTSNSTLSKSKSMFRNVLELAKEFANQSEA